MPSSEGASFESDVFEKLDQVAHHRQRFAPLLATLVRRQFEHLPTAGPIVEVGAGDGQLTQHFPAELRPRYVLTEPTATGVQRLTEVFPDIEVRQAPAEALPVETGSAAAVLGGCVLDVVADLNATVREFHRVLQPGGRVVHWLDMSTDLRPLLAEIVEASNLCLLPNVFTDPNASAWPDDLMVVPRAQLDAIAAVLEGGPHRAAAAALVDYRAAQDNVDRAFEAFAALHESAEGRRALFATFKTAMRMASAEQRAQLSRFEGRPLSSARIFHERLLSADWSGFDIEFADIEHLQATTAPTGDAAAGAFKSIVGFTQSGHFAAGPTGKHHVHLGVHVFRARRRP